MPTYVAVSAMILSFAVTATAQRAHPRAFLSDLDDDPAPLSRDSGFRTASHRRAPQKDVIRRAAKGRRRR